MVSPSTDRCACLEYTEPFLAWATYDPIQILRMKPDRPLSPQGSSRAPLIHSEISGAIIGAFYIVYNELGFGFLETIYARALEIVLRSKGLVVEREFPVVVQFQGQPIGFHRCDMLVERRVIVEIKATELLAEASKRQLRNYLSAMNVDLGMLLHFGPRANYYRVLGPQRSARA